MICWAYSIAVASRLSWTATSFLASLPEAISFPICAGICRSPRSNASLADATSKPLQKNSTFEMTGRLALELNFLICEIRVICGSPFSDEELRHRYPHHSRRTGTRPFNWRDHDADLRDFDLRPGKPWEAQRLRLLALNQSDTAGLRKMCR